MPTPEQVERALEAMRKLTANYVYFFQHVDSADWIEPLRAHDFFKDPPAPEDTPDGMRSFPQWPESQYLVRVADQAPDLVAKTLLALPNSDNIFVHDDVVQAALKLSGSLARQISERERKWVGTQKQLFWLLPERYADLVVHLAREGELGEALLLAHAILDVREDPRWAAATDEQKVYISRQPVGLMQHWEYQRAVEKALPALTSADSLAAVQLFADLLQNAMRLSEPIKDGDPGDHSYIWRPAIEEHQQNLPAHSVRDVLVTALRDAAVAASQADPSSTPRIIEELEKRRRSIFRRIVLHVLAEVDGADPSLAVDRLSDWETFDDPALRHEYARLAKARFQDVPEQRIEGLLEHLKTPPLMDNFRRNFESRYGRSPSDEEIEQTQQGIELRRLAILADFLPQTWRARYKELTDKLGAPEHPDFTSYSSGVWTGPTSPKTADELLAMEVDELLVYLRDWRPPAGPHADSYDGLGRQLTAAVAAQPERFTAAAIRFADLDPTYVRAVLDGFDQALGDNKWIEWPVVLELMEFVVRQPVAAEQGDEAAGWEDRDPGWRWARGSVAHLLSEGLKRTDPAIPIELREEVWAVIAPLTEDPEPTPEYEARYGGSNMDPLTLSINTNRGKALHAVVSYALWVRRNDERHHPDRIDQGFNALPEVGEVLTAHLDPARDPSVAVRAVYGERLPWLVLLDQAWVTDHLSGLFPDDPARRSLRNAVWDTYVVNDPYDNMFEVLLSEYHRAVEEVGKATSDDERRRFVDPAARLGEHLMALYLRGRLTWDNEGALLTEFFDRAPDAVRAEALDFVGRSLWQGEFELPAEPAERLRELWDRRFAAYEHDKDAGRKEVASFGWWFASKGKLSDEWLLSRLLRLLESGASTDADHLVMERLVELAQDHLREAIYATRLMVKVQKEPHFALGSQEPLRQLVSMAAVAEDDQAKSEARGLLNDLVARGFNGLDDLAAES